MFQVYVYIYDLSSKLRQQFKSTIVWKVLRVNVSIRLKSDI